MSNHRLHTLMLWCAATDKTFERVMFGDHEALRGKCIHCNSALTINLKGKPLDKASLEHIVPQTHGGTDDLANLSLACKKCNNLKGCRLDRRPLSDPTLAAVIETLTRRKAERARPPLASLSLPPLPPISTQVVLAEAEPPPPPPRRGRKGRKRKSRR
ncbi:MAG: HNH endonuclease [Bradymonadia bacterium]